MLRTGLGYKRKVLSGLLWAGAFPWALKSLSKCLLYMQLLLNVLVFKVWFPKREKDENDKGSSKCASPLNSWQLLQLEGEGLATMGNMQEQWLSWLYTSVIRSRNEQSEDRSAIFCECPPWLPQDACKLHQKPPHRCWLLSWGRVMVSRDCFRSWNWPKLTAMCCLHLPWKLRAFNRLEF